MQYFGVPTCPYCRKRVNLIRVWSLKRQGEYRCPRCGGISNIFLSPLIYVFALLAIFAGGALYFFHKFVLDDISLKTIWQVALPFAVFFLLSLFLVYLEKPVIKKIPKAELQKERRNNFEDRRIPGAPPVSREAMSYDSDEYLPKGEYRTGTLPKVNPAPEMQRTSVVELPRAQAARAPQKTAQRARRPAPSPSPSRASAVREESPVSQKAASPASGDFFSKYEDPEYVNRRLQEIREKRGTEN